MLQTVLTFRDFIKDNHKEQFAFMPLQIENCMLLQEFIKDEKLFSRTVLHIFDSHTNYIGTIQDPHFIPDRIRSI